MKKIVASVAVVLSLALVFVGCSKKEGTASAGNKAADSGVTEISLWTYPIGGWGDQKTVDTLLAGFHAANPSIKVTVDYLTYADGDDKVNTAIEGGAAPDLIMEGPERLVANWGAKGKMVTSMMPQTRMKSILLLWQLVSPKVVLLTSIPW